MLDDLGEAGGRCPMQQSYWRKSTSASTAKPERKRETRLFMAASAYINSSPMISLSHGLINRQ
jgi:hypothetical protein